MPIIDGVYIPLTFENALAQIIDAAPDTIKFAPGNPPELIEANMFARASQIIDAQNGQLLAALMTPTGALIDLLNPNNPRRGIIFTKGYLLLQNYTDADIPVLVNTEFTASSGQVYTIGSSSVTVPAAVDEYTPGEAFCYVTAVVGGIGGNIPANRTFTAGGLALTITNPLPWLNGANAESDALYYNRTIKEKSEYGSQVTSVAAEKELELYYSAARIWVNKSGAAQTEPVPIPGNGYNAVVRFPNGALANALETASAFDVLSRRFELINSQSLGDVRHAVLSGTIYVTGVPQSYYATAAQAVDTTLTATIYVRFAPYTAREEKISQANDFAVNYIKRLMSYFSGVAGTSTITFVEDEHPDTETDIEFAADIGLLNPIAPAFSAAQMRDLISDLATNRLTPQLMYDSTPAIVMTLDPEVGGEDPVTIGFGEYDRQFIDFLRDALFSDDTSWYDRYMFIDPAQINITIQEID